MHLAELPTPAAVVDAAVLRRNCERMGERVAAQGLALRPHVKTHKVPAIARLQGGEGITVSTAPEVRAFAAAGFTDQTLAVPLAPGRIPEAVALAADLDLGLLVDDLGVVEALGRTARDRRQTVAAWLKVDCGYGRAGVDPAHPGALRVAEALDAHPWLDWRGLLTHAGHSYDCLDRAGIRQVASQEVAVIRGFAGDLRGRGLTVPAVSIGSTPTLSVAVDRTGVSEARPGNYVFHDLHQEGIGACRAEDIALSVVSSVIGVYPQRGTVVLDAGALALSKDPGPTHLKGPASLGRVCDLDGRPLQGLALVGLSQEHGKVRVTGPDPGLQVGDKVRVLPNHSCLVAALHPILHVVEDGRRVEQLHPVRGW